MEQQHIYNFPLHHLNPNIDMTYTICLVIPTKVDTSQVPQQNVNWMPTVKAMIKDNLIQKPHLYHHSWSVNITCLRGCEVS